MNYLKIDVIVLLFGLYKYDKELFDELMAKSKELDIPLLSIRFYGMEAILKELEEKADAVVGWNPHCIINAIESLTDRENWVKPCDIAEDE